MMVTPGIIHIYMLFEYLNAMGFLDVMLLVLFSIRDL